MSSASCSSGMSVLQLVESKVSFPTGDPSFSVMQAFPGPFPSSSATDPFLMCDHFGPTVSEGPPSHPDEFPIDWHPHRGMDILTYLLRGIGRHGDSLGNRESYHTPGMQWTSVGSGIEHAEGFMTPKGEVSEGFQIWINVPSDLKMKDPAYGTEPPENIPVLSLSGGSQVRILAGNVDGGAKPGPFQTVQPVQIVDVDLKNPQGDTYLHQVPAELDTTIVYVYRGKGHVAGTPVRKHHVVLLDASHADQRTVSIQTDPGSDPADLGVIVFSGKKLRQPIAWRGPFVMTTQEEIIRTIQEYQNGTFLKKRAPFNYKKFSQIPKDWDPSQI